MNEHNIHASCVAIGSAGVLLLGKSGAGKSDLALRLIDDGAVLVADDRVLLSVSNGVLQARAPDTIRGLLEIRGLGIVQMPVKKIAAVRLAVRLGREAPRLPQIRHYDSPLPLTQIVPLVALDPHSASTPAKIRAALSAFSKDLFRSNFNTK
jgi:serine kinase of HPr protein (carbohydrate metabolism regulator)